MVILRELWPMVQCLDRDHLRAGSIRGSDGHCPRTSVIEHLGSGHSGSECTLGKLADDTKVSGEVDTLEEQDAIQRHLDRLQRWDHVNLMKFTKTNCEVLHLSWGNPIHG